jgi:hypothetical protein
MPLANCRDAVPEAGAGEDPEKAAVAVDEHIRRTAEILAPKALMDD